MLLFAPWTASELTFFTLLDKRNCLYSRRSLALQKLLTPYAFLPDPGPGIVLALYPTHMIDTDGGTYALLDDAFIRYLRDLK